MLFGMNRDGKNIFSALVNVNIVEATQNTSTRQLISLILVIAFSFAVIFISPVFALALCGVVLVIIGCWRHPLWALLILAIWLPFEPLALKWVSDELYVLARYTSEFLIYALAATVLIKSVIQWRTLPKTPFIIALGLIAVLTLASAVVNGNVIFDSLMGFRQIFRFVLLFIVVLLIDVPRKFVAAFIISIIVIATLQSSIGLAQFASQGALDGWLAPTERKSFESLQLTSGTDLFWEGGQRIFATMGRYDQLGIFLSFVLLMIIGFFYQQAISRKRYWLYALASLGMIIALILTYSRASWFGFAFGAGLITIVLMRDKRVIVGLLIACFLAVISYLSYGIAREYLRDMPSQTIAERFFEAFSPERFYGEYYDHGRLYFAIQTPLKVAQHTPLLGVGPGYYGGGAATALHQTEGAEKLGLPFGIRGSEGYIDNSWFSLLGELGYIGFAIYVFMIVLLFRTGYRVFRFSDTALMRGVGLGYCGFVAALSFQALLGTYFEVRTIAPYLWIIGGFLTREEILAKEKHGRHLQLDAVQGVAEERSKAYGGGTTSSVAGDNEEMRHRQVSLIL